MNPILAALEIAQSATLRLSRGAAYWVALAEGCLR
jgi:hypothetical protein